MHVFTSIAANYLPKAAVLAHTVKKWHPEATFHVILSDQMPSCPSTTLAAFDDIIPIKDLPISHLPAWTFRHRLVELCTAVKGIAFQYIADRFGAERIYYFDPDVALMNRIDQLQLLMDRHCILLTPHLTVPERDPRAVIENEMGSLRHGVYNLGFLGVRMAGEGRRFIDWWADRLREHCYDDIPRGLFTDQRWVDLAPALFDDIAIVRDTRYNVAAWNLNHRCVTGNAPFDVQIDGNPLVFYHFTGLDSGDHAALLDRYGSDGRVLRDLRRWYADQCKEFGQDSVGKAPWAFATFRNGEPITNHHRIIYSSRPDLMRTFPDPFDDSQPNRSYFHWYASQGLALQLAQEAGGTRTSLRKIIKAHAPAPALRLARSACSAIRGLSRTAGSIWGAGSRHS